MIGINCLAVVILVARCANRIGVKRTKPEGLRQLFGSDESGPHSSAGVYGEIQASKGCRGEWSAGSPVLNKNLFEAFQGSSELVHNPPESSGATGGARYSYIDLDTPQT